ncbi:NAD(P)/FAD-dependent oxidoreductase [Chitinophaga sp. GbtcB8]|uniref:NAD(P)/FAD-dependent oxidoreductase n=1 Tax=Chitinophaga sp. GbtcB8 TaxID=2824753 RepID=UPI001C30A764|nr:NAD(P)/FAD-dependent oxidoreductase [Chitinophaga sp. GbtcB8]
MEKTNNTERKQVVVIGGGFSGLNFVKNLFHNKYYAVTVVDKNNYNYFTPLLYQVATSFLEPSSISYPFRKLFKKKDISFRMAELVRVDTAASKVYLNDGGELHYDVLVFAAGSKTNFFGNDGLRHSTFSLKGIDDALYMRNELIKTLEKAVIEQDPIEKKRLLTIVIAGGGPTGVEVAGMLAEMRKYILEHDYPELKNTPTEIYVVDGAPYLLAPMSDKTHKAAHKELEKLGVHVKLNTRVKNYENDQVHLSDGEVIEAKSLIWAAGVIANTFDGISAQSVGKGGRMVTDAFNRVQGYENVYAIGDISIQFTDSAYPDGHPQLAQPAIQQGKSLAKNLLRMAKGRPLKPFKYFDRGDMAIIGRQFAVADLFKHKVHLGGLLGLLSWLFIHLVSLVNYNNRIKTLYNWAVAYTTRDQALRMIFRSGNRENRD